MTDNNENNTENKTEPERGSDGRFLPGNKLGGKKNLKKLSYADIEDNLQQDLKSRDPKVRHNATKLLLLMRKQKQGEAVKEDVSPFMLEVVGFIQTMTHNMSEGRGQTLGAIEAIHIMKNICPTCDKVGAVDCGGIDMDNMDLEGIGGDCQ